MRPNWPEYFMWLAVVAATRSTCSRLKVGCVIVDREGYVKSTGYNGSAPGASHDPLLHDGRNVRTIHAEANAVAHAHCDLRGSTAYVTTFPCRECIKLLGAAGVKSIVWLEAYASEDNTITAKLAMDAGVSMKKFEGREPWSEDVSSWLKASTEAERAR